MKVCFRCGIEKSLTEFYEHPKMGDGRLGKCKACTKSDSMKRHYEKAKDPKWVEAERIRSREKYHRLNYNERYKEIVAEKKWTNTSKYKKIYRDLKIDRVKGIELHHWNYNDKYLRDVVKMDITSHKRLHSHLFLDIDKRIFKDVEGNYLDTKEKHLAYINKLGFKYELIN